MVHTCLVYFFVSHSPFVAILLFHYTYNKQLNYKKRIKFGYIYIYSHIFYVNQVSNMIVIEEVLVIIAELCNENIFIKTFPWQR